MYPRRRCKSQVRVKKAEKKIYHGDDENLNFWSWKTNNPLLPLMSHYLTLWKKIFIRRQLIIFWLENKAKLKKNQCATDRQNEKRDSMKKKIWNLNKMWMWSEFTVSLFNQSKTIIFSFQSLFCSKYDTRRSTKVYYSGGNFCLNKSHSM